MNGSVEWSLLISIVGLVCTVAATAGAVAWLVRGIKADLQEGQGRTRETIMRTAEILTDKIAASRGFLRDEFQAALLRVEEAASLRFDKLEANDASLGAKLDMHRSEDATRFLEHGERIARLEAAE